MNSDSQGLNEQAQGDLVQDQGLQDIAGQARIKDIRVEAEQPRSYPIDPIPNEIQIPKEEMTKT